VSFSGLKTRINEHCDFSDVILLLSFILVGGFNDYLACLISAVLLFFLIFKILKQKSFQIRLNLLTVSVFAVVGFYALTMLWAIDTGMAFIGFLRFLPLAVYVILLAQPQKKKKIFEILPYFVAVITLISVLASLVPPLKSMFLVSERLAGFFQYPNTFALLLLVCELLLLKKTRFKWLDFITLAVLIGGLLYTGSRTAFILFLVSNFFMVLTNASKKMRILIFSVSAVVVLAVTLIAFLGPDGNVLSRYLKIGLTQSTFIGRLLYIFDSLPLLLKYPFGMGYMGYQFVQGSIQTGVYNVSYVHNDFLQLALDVGVIPAVMFFAAVVRFFFKKHVNIAEKIIVATISLHSMFDFNLQFVGMFLLFLLFLDDQDGKIVTVNNVKSAKMLAFVFAVINVYMCVALALSQFTAYETSDALYPYNTRNKLLLLEQQTDIAAANDIANEILEQNTHYYAPYSIKAKYCYSKGDFRGVIENKNASLSRIRFRYTELREYGVMLVNGIMAYEQMGDTSSAKVLKDELLSLKAGMEASEQYISKFGSMINEKPITTLPNDILDYIEKITKETGDLN